MKLKIVEPDAHIKGRAASHMNVLEEVEHMLIDSHILIIITSKNLSEGISIMLYFYTTSIKIITYKCTT